MGERDGQGTTFERVTKPSKKNRGGRWITPKCFSLTCRSLAMLAQPFPIAQLCRWSRPALQTPTAFCITSCCGTLLVVLRHAAIPRIEQVPKPTHARTLFPQSSVRGTSRHSRSASARPIECAPVRSDVPLTVLGTAWLVSSGSLSQRIAYGCPRTATIPARASPSDWQKLVSNSKVGTLACTHHLFGLLVQPFSDHRLLRCFLPFS